MPGLPANRESDDMIRPIIEPINPHEGGYVVLSLEQFNDLRKESGMPIFTEEQFSSIGEDFGEGFRMLEIPSNNREDGE